MEPICCCAVKWLLPGQSSACTVSQCMQTLYDEEPLDVANVANTVIWKKCLTYLVSKSIFKMLDICHGLVSPCERCKVQRESNCKTIGYLFVFLSDFLLFLYCVVFLFVYLFVLLNLSDKERLRYLGISILCYFIPLLHYISEANCVFIWWLWLLVSPQINMINLMMKLIKYNTLLKISVVFIFLKDLSTSSTSEPKRKMTSENISSLFDSWSCPAE